MRQDHETWTIQLAHMTNELVMIEADLLLLPLSIGIQKSTAMNDAGATHNFLSMTMVNILKSTMPECIS